MKLTMDEEDDIVIMGEKRASITTLCHFFFFLVNHVNCIKLGINQSVTSQVSFIKSYNAFHHRWWIQKYNKRG